MQDIKPNNRPVVPQVARPVAHSNRRQSRKISLLIGAIVAALIIIGALSYYLLNSKSQIDNSKYQAVFLNNNQVYFGKLHGYYTNRPYLTSVWYIQTPDSATGGNSKAPAQSSQLQLQKLNTSVHGPEDEMILNKSQILFVENLSSDSQVTKLINSNK